MKKRILCTVMAVTWLGSMKKYTAAAVMAVAMVSSLFMGCSNKAAEKDDSTSAKYENGNSLGNIRNDGQILEYGDSIIFAAGNGVYKINKNGTGCVKLSDKGNCTFLNLYNDSIYCVHKDTDLYRIKLDGTEDTHVLHNYSDLPLPYGIIIDEDTMYLSCEYTLDLAKLGNSSSIGLGEIYDTNESPMGTINIVDDAIYFYGKETDSKSEEAGIYKMNVDGEERKKIYEGYVYFSMVDGEWIYCWDYVGNSNSMFRIKLDGTDKQVLLDYSDSEDTYVSAVNVKDGWIYYELSGDAEKGIYKMKVDGTDKQLLTSNCSSQSTGGLYIVDEWIYYYLYESCNLLMRVKIDGTEDKQFVVVD